MGPCGFGATAYYVLNIMHRSQIERYVVTSSAYNTKRARSERAVWVGDISTEDIQVMLDAAILFLPAGNLVEPIITHVKPRGVLVMAHVSSTTITIEDYSSNPWGRSIRTFFHLNRCDGEMFIDMVNDLDLKPSVSLFPLEKVDKALILVKEGKLDQVNAVIAVWP